MIIFTLLFLVFLLGGFFILSINDYDIKKAIRYMRVKFFSCCIKEKKKLEEKIGVVAIKKIEGDLIDIKDCKEPVESIPLDLCLSSELEIEELKIREKIFRQLKERDNFIVDGGKNKMILPLEATIFLTKSFNPLVSEDGNILIISEHKKVSDSTEFEEIRMYLKDNSVKNNKGELIYKDDESILNLIKANISKEVDTVEEKRKFTPTEVIDKDILSGKENFSSSNDIFEDTDNIESDTSNDDMFGDIDKELNNKSNDDIFGDIDKELNNNKSNDDIFGDIDKELNNKSNDDIFGDIDKELNNKSNDDIFGDIDKELNNPTVKKVEKVKEVKKVEKVEEVKKEETPPEEFSMEGNPFDEDELDFSKIDEEISLDMNELEFDDEEEEEEIDSRDSFYKKIKYRTLSIPNLNKESLEDDILEIFKNNELKEAIMNNILKTKPLIFNANKEVVFIDMKNILFAISKVYGIEYKKKLDMFNKMKIKDLSKIQKIIAEEFKDEISDLITDKKGLSKAILERDNQYYYSFGIYIMTDKFKKVLSDDDFDFFRQYPYNTEYKISDISNQTKTPLLPSMNDCEI